ncbi:MAG: hypothetical protein AAFR71_09925 [Pseudomonadota bacterium]
MTEELEYTVEMRDQQGKVIECFARLEGLFPARMVFDHYAAKFPNDIIMCRHRVRVVKEHKPAVTLSHLSVEKK